MRRAGDDEHCRRDALLEISVNPRPLNVRLPFSSHQVLRRKAKQIQSAFPLVSGAFLRVNAIQNALAACVGYRSFSELQTWSDNDKCACMAVSEGELRLRQRFRELVTMSQLLPDASPSEIVELVDSLDVVNWAAVQQTEELGGADARPCACPLSRKPVVCATPEHPPVRARYRASRSGSRAFPARTPLWQRCLQHEMRLRTTQLNIEVAASLCSWRRRSSPAVRSGLAQPPAPCPGTGKHNIGSQV